ncbi:hypothetical protein [Sulfuracidifex metallicus]|nr:hypothetical protein [Sulfuracidifex metallicus]WOE50462.1 hypothetical protein RQ359_001991 [Sulfuracidifex metallicus DSM 6482 = JCM 9184]
MDSVNSLIEKLRYVIVGVYLLGSIAAVMFLALGITLINFQ